MITTINGASMNYKSILILTLIISLFIGCAKKADNANVKVEEIKNHFQFSYEVTVPQSETAFQTGEIFIPIPQTNDCQVVHDISITTNGSYQVLQEPEYKNRYAKIVFDDSLQSDLNISVVLDITRKLHDNYTTKKMVTVEQPAILKRFLQSDSLVPIDGVVASEAGMLITDSMTTIEKAQAIYNHLYETMQYDKSGEGWGRGDALYACDIRKGNCTDFHSLFIGMARSVGIPARFLIGFPLPFEKTQSEIKGYHC